MPYPEAGTHIRLDLYQERSSAVTATITGTPTRTIHTLLTIHGFEPLDEQTMVMARVDREEPRYEPFRRNHSRVLRGPLEPKPERGRSFRAAFTSQAEK